jgi:hypothetical protein
MKATPQTIDIRQRRIQAVLQIRLDGAELWDVRDFIAEKEQAGEDPWTIGDGGTALNAAQINLIVKAADTRIAQSSPGDPPEVARHKAKLRNLYARSIQVGDVRTARSILCDLGKLDGLNRRKTSTPAVPNKIKAATEKLRAKLKKGKANAKRKTTEAGGHAHPKRDVPPGSPQRERTEADAGDTGTPETPFEVCPPDVGSAN